MLNSYYLKLLPVSLPFAERQHYMHTMDLASPSMPAGFEDYVPIVAALCAAVGAHVGQAYVTVDEKLLLVGQTQRRPGPHVDGCFYPALMSWEHGTGWNHYCNGLPVARMPVIVVSSVAACRVWRGLFAGQPAEGGDLSHLVLDAGELLPANVGHWLSPDCVHESLPMTVNTARTFLRIALPALDRRD